MTPERYTTDQINAYVARGRTLQRRALAAFLTAPFRRLFAKRQVVAVRRQGCHA